MTAVRWQLSLQLLKGATVTKWGDVKSSVTLVARRHPQLFLVNSIKNYKSVSFRKRFIESAVLEGDRPFQGRLNPGRIWEVKRQKIKYISREG